MPKTNNNFFILLNINLLNTTSSLSDLLQSFDLKDFLTQNKQIDSITYSLRNKGNKNGLNWLLAEQLKIYPKALAKIPTFALNHCWFTSKSYEQSSSEASAKYKASLYKGKKMLDLSGGLGVDDWAFSQTFDNIISLDPDENLNLLVRENYNRLKINNIERIEKRAEEYLNENKDVQFDLIYLDADRRSENKRNYFLDQGSPNYLEIADNCFEISDKVLLKLSPMVDITYLKSTLKWIEKVIVLGDKYEVKELLVLLNKNFSGECKIETAVLYELEKTLFFSSNSNNNIPTKNSFDTKSVYFFEPHPAIIKAELSNSYANFCGLNQLATNSNYFLGNEVPENFIGRSFELYDCFEFSKTQFQNYLKNKAIHQANISRRNFILSVEEIRKTFKIKEGGKDYLFFSTLSNGTKMVYHGTKTN